jgi:hypothetical protein
MYETIIKLFFIVFVVGFVILLIIKRFLYLRPTYEFLRPIANYEELYEGSIHSWFLQGTNDNVILFCHGNSGNISHRQTKIIELNKMGYSVLIFDYTGFGQSIGVPSEQNCYNNACVYADFLVKKYSKDNIIMYGESIGASVASYTALRYNIPILIIESGLPSIKTLLSKYKILTLFGFLFNDYNTVSYLKYYKGRTLIMHCKNDEIVPWNITNEMRKYGTKVIEMTGSHNNPTIPWNYVNEFIERI